MLRRRNYVVSLSDNSLTALMGVTTLYQPLSAFCRPLWLDKRRNFLYTRLLCRTDLVSSIRTTVAGFSKPKLVFCARRGWARLARLTKCGNTAPSTGQTLRWAHDLTGRPSANGGPENCAPVRRPKRRRWPSLSKLHRSLCTGASNLLQTHPWSGTSPRARRSRAGGLTLLLFR